jgi:SAM-dependent methyltransferase
MMWTSVYMMTDRDAYGHQIYDYHMGIESIEIIERDDGLVDYTDSLPGAYFSDYPDWPEYERKGMKYVQGRVLDIGCGAGRHCLHLQEQGHEVVGIDLSPLAVEVCRERGVRDARLLNITQIDSSLGTFDTILMMGNNFGLVGNMRRARWLLRRFKAITTPDARILGASRDPYKTTTEHHLDYHRLNRCRGRMAGQVRLRVRYKKFSSKWFDYLLVSQDEMMKIAEGTGWHVERFVDSAGSTYIGIIERDHPT